MSTFFKNWHWGKGIALTIAILCGGIIFIVYKASTYNYDMVIDQYYEEELKFNDQARAIKNAAALSAPLKIEQVNDYIIIEFPPECANKDIKGKLQLYRASDATKDIMIPLVFTSGNIITIPLSQTIKGNYNVIAQWIMDGKEYKFVEEYNVR